MLFKKHFYIPKSDRRAILAILVLTTFVGIAIYALNFVGNESNTPENHDKSNKQESDFSAKQNPAYKGKKYNYKVENKETKLFYFDPNTADSTQLLQLGLQPWQVRSIYKYRAKGGIYRKKEDFAYVYGLTAKDYKRLAPYIRIGEDYRPAYELAEVKRARQQNYYSRPNTYYKSTYSSSANQNHENRNSERNPSGNGTPAGVSPKHQANYSPKLHAGEHLSVNSADTTALKTIPGIGSYFARRIVRYREQLGGFFDKEQLLDIEDFPKEALDFINIDSGHIKKLKVNQLSLKQLRNHPYINYYQARAITDYRRLHGEIKDIKELRLMKEFTDNDIKRIQPYLEY